jgi:hypothetical protein
MLMVGKMFIVSAGDYRKHYKALTGYSHSPSFIDDAIKRSCRKKDGKMEVYTLESGIGKKPFDEIISYCKSSGITYDVFEFEYMSVYMSV